MLKGPPPDWVTPASTWNEVVDRYVLHRQMPTWRGRTHDQKGRRLPDRLSRQEAEKLRQLLLKQLAKHERLLPSDPRKLDTATFTKLLDARALTGRPVGKCPRWIQELRKAAVLNSAGYTCRWCRRTAWDVFKNEGRTLRFEMDHRQARSRIANCNDFDMRNIVAACRSCNVIKGQMEEGPFWKELMSLAAAVTAQDSARR